jgi:hypothetical protein
LLGVERKEAPHATHVHFKSLVGNGFGPRAAMPYDLLS